MRESSSPSSWKLAALMAALVILISSLHGADSQANNNRKRRRLPGGKLEAPDFDCPEDFGYYAHQSDCSLYYVCVFGGALLESCTGGLLYSDELQTCDWPRNVKCKDNATIPDADAPSSGVSTIKVTDPRTSSTASSSPSSTARPFPADAADQQQHGDHLTFPESGVQEQIDFNSVGGIDKQALDKFSLLDDSDFGNGEEFSVAADGEAAPTKTRFYRKSDPAPSPAVVDDPRRPSFGRSAQQFVTPTRDPSSAQVRGSFQQQAQRQQQFQQPQQRQPPPPPPQQQRATSSPRDEFGFSDFPDNSRFFEQQRDVTPSSSGVGIRNQGSAGQRFPTLFPSTESSQTSSRLFTVPLSNNAVTTPTPAQTPSGLPPPVHRQPATFPTARDDGRQGNFFTTPAPPAPQQQFVRRPERVRDVFQSFPSTTTTTTTPSTTTAARLQQAQQPAAGSPDYAADGAPLYVYDYYEYDVEPDNNGAAAPAAAQQPHQQQQQQQPPHQAATPAPAAQPAPQQHQQQQVHRQPKDQTPHRFINTHGQSGQPSAADFQHFQEATTAAPKPEQNFNVGSNVLGSRFSGVKSLDQQHQSQQQQHQFATQQQPQDAFSQAEEDSGHQGRTSGSSSLFVRDRTRTRSDWTDDNQRGHHNSLTNGAENNVVSTTSAPAPQRTPAPQRSNRQRPTLKPASKLVPKKATQAPLNIWASVPQRPPPVYPQPPYNEPATKCRPETCILPDCYCGGGKTVPGGYEPQDIPQVVLLTFDDAVNDLNKELFADLFERGRTNPNGCPIQATFYVSHEWTDYSQVQNLYADGHEIASHTISHSFGENFSEKRWAQEVEGQRDVMAAYAGVLREDIRGMRAPFLQIGGDKMFKMLYDRNFTYDSSMPVYENKPPSFPYTLDYKIFHDCMIPPCPKKSFPGVWEVPMVMWQDLKGGRCSMVDGCSAPGDAEGIYKMLIKNFERHYTTNRAPVGLFFHAAWFTHEHHKEGFIAFLDTITAMDDVWLVTNWQSIQWMREPTPLSHIKNFKPFGCHYPERPSRCSRAQVCNVWHNTGVRYMKTCQACPAKYPWTGNTGVTPANEL